MKKTIKYLLLGSLPFIFILYLTFLYSVIKTDWNYAHKSMYTYQNPFNWLEYKFKVGVVKSIINFRENKNLGLNTKRIYVEEQNQKRLLIDTPRSTKNWQQGFYYDQTVNDLKEMSVRFRGDNPRNWLFEKKHWRIKTRKNEIIDQKRYFDFLPYDFNKYFSGKIANEIGVLSPEFDLTELYVNDRSQGVYIESENLNESFLRRKKIMPVNLYKAENILDESIIGLEMNAFNSPGAVSKNSIFNQIERDDKSDLTFFLELIRLSNYDRVLFENLIDTIGIEKWAKFVAYQILTQNFHNDNSHNLRLVSDPWSGNLTPIAQDPLIGNLDENNFNINYSSNDIILLLNQSSVFNHKKLESIYQILNYKIIDNLIEEFKKDEKKILISEKRDVEALVKNFNIFTLLSNLINQKYIDPSKKSPNNEFLDYYKEYLVSLISYIERKPNGKWKKNKEGFAISVDGDLPVSNLKIYFKESETPKWIFLDLNENGKLDDKENKFYFNATNDYFSIPFNFYANRMNFIGTTNYLSHIDLKTLNTRFTFITDNKVSPTSIKFENPFSKKDFELEQKNFKAQPSSILNYPFSDKLISKNVLRLKGVYQINKTKIFNEPVIIDPGTIFNLKKGVSLIFKNNVKALGTQNLPILFQRSENDYWGTIALIGDKTTNSVFENVIFDGGSGLTKEHFKEKSQEYFSIGNLRFISSVSVHKTENIYFKNIEIKNNYEYDDTIHIIYSKNILIENLKIENAFGDAIDIDMSSNINLKNINIFNAKNDAIDLMESNVVINNSYLSGSNDKGVSVGENSFLVIIDSTIVDNNIGIATKDHSYSLIDNLIFENNDFHIQNYKKNWRYGDGGISEIQNSKFFINDQDNQNFNSKFKSIKIDDYSSLKIKKSEFESNKIEQNIFSEINKSKHLKKISKIGNDNRYKDLLKILRKN